MSRTMRGGPVYAEKACQYCGKAFTPTSGRQHTCTAPECRRQQRQRLQQRQRNLYGEKNPRPAEKQCEWDGCETVFVVPWTGSVPAWCEKHRREHSLPKMRANRVRWTQRTLNESCRMIDCENPQHPASHGWCFKHYPIWDVHGVSADFWWEMFDKQGGVCPICKEALTNETIIAIDHDPLAPRRHTVAHVRGLLHATPCNNVILGGIEIALQQGLMQNVLEYIGLVAGIEPAPTDHHENRA